MRRYLVVPVLIMCTAVTVQESNGSSQLKLELRPGVIHPIFTKKFHLHCSVQNKNRRAKVKETTVKEVKSSSDQPLWNGVDLKSPQEAKSTLSQEKADFSQLLSLVVTKLDPDTDTNVTIASVSGCDVPVIEKAFLDLVEVEGSSEGSPRDGEQGYLTLTWDRPVSGDAGSFTCEAYALNKEKHPVSLYASVYVETVETTIPDLVEYVLLTDKYIFDLKTKIADISEEMKSVTLENKRISDKMKTLKKGSVQTGTVACGTDKVTFSPAFNSTPTVFTSLNIFSATLYRDNSYSKSMSVSMSVISVTKSNFVPSCNYDYSSATFSWIAFDV
ncbi:DSC-2 [Biomphalaria pfeifferi]|uniref:DSC-2 n=1 Tax=Biomphalaria pfeifferi TaxID=112525 RepID=A0AAD8BB03_BIOPF|nr:DSC-2 [Biomphalaria pfeifferi]